MTNRWQKENILLKRFPKRRSTLPEEYIAIYEKEYFINRGRKTLITKISGGLEDWMHKKVASVQGQSVLEIGAGTLNHVPWELNASCYDVVEPFKELYLNSEHRFNVNRFYGDINEIKSACLYDKVITIAALEHICDLPILLARVTHCLKDNGVFQVAIPSEGGFLWWLSWRCVTGLAFWLRNRLDYSIIMKHEHVNTAGEIEGLIRLLFEDVKVKRYPFFGLNFSFYSYIEARKPNPEIALRWADLAEQ